MQSAYIDVDEHWGVIINYDYDQMDYDDMWAIMRSFGMSERKVKQALRILSCYNTGMTVSNEDLRMSAIFISKATSPSEWFSTAIHELKHTADSIISYYDVDWQGEDAAYLTGFLTKELMEKVDTPCG